MRIVSEPRPARLLSWGSVAALVVAWTTLACDASEGGGSAVDAGGGVNEPDAADAGTPPPVADAEPAPTEGPTGVPTRYDPPCDFGEALPLESTRVVTYADRVRSMRGASPYGPPAILRFVAPEGGFWQFGAVIAGVPEPYLLDVEVGPTCGSDDRPVPGGWRWGDDTRRFPVVGLESGEVTYLRVGRIPDGTSVEVSATRVSVTDHLGEVCIRSSRLFCGWPLGCRPQPHGRHRCAPNPPAVLAHAEYAFEPSRERLGLWVAPSTPLQGRIDLYAQTSAGDWLLLAEGLGVEESLFGPAEPVSPFTFVVPWFSDEPPAEVVISVAPDEPMSPSLWSVPAAATRREVGAEGPCEPTGMFLHCTRGDCSAESNGAQGTCTSPARACVPDISAAEWRYDERGLDRPYWEARAAAPTGENRVTPGPASARPQPEVIAEFTAPAAGVYRFVSTFPTRLVLRAGCTSGSAQGQELGGYTQQSLESMGPAVRLAAGETVLAIAEALAPVEYIEFAVFRLEPPVAVEGPRIEIRASPDRPGDAAEMTVDQSLVAVDFMAECQCRFEARDEHGAIVPLADAFEPEDCAEDMSFFTIEVPRGATIRSGRFIADCGQESFEFPSADASFFEPSVRSVGQDCGWWSVCAEGTSCRLFDASLLCSDADVPVAEAITLEFDPTSGRLRVSLLGTTFDPNIEVEVLVELTAPPGAPADLPWFVELPADPESAAPEARVFSDYVYVPAPPTHGEVTLRLPGRGSVEAGGADVVLRALPANTP
jgi:hypothetical protein